jgi:hypothetical protein
MPPFETECVACHQRYDVPDPYAIETPTTCPRCGGALKLVTGVDAGFLNRRCDFVPPRRARPIGPACELERTGSTCCGLPDPCRLEPCCVRD